MAPSRIPVGFRALVFRALRVPSSRIGNLSAFCGTRTSNIVPILFLKVNLYSSRSSCGIWCRRGSGFRIHGWDLYV